MKELWEMSWDELENFVKEATGLQTPRQNAPRKEWVEWYVASALIMLGGVYNDPAEVMRHAIEWMPADSPEFIAVLNGRQTA